MVKVHVAPQRAGGAKAAALHLRYIERDGVEKDGSPGVLYSADGPLSHEVFGSPRRNEKHQFRVIVSPEDATELELDLYVRRFMSQVERDLGQRLEWAAVNHFDTEHPHAHIVIRGVDLAGREVRLPRAYVSHGLRDRAQELATEELGPRPEHDLRRQRERETTLERFTGLDRAIERRAVGTRIELTEERTGDRGRQAESLTLARLRYLEALRLAERIGPRSWDLVPGWQEHLRELGMRGDIIKQMHRALRGDVARYDILEVSSFAEPGQPLYGRVAKKGLSDEQRGTYFAIVETPSGRGCYVPLDAGVTDVREGDVVRIESKPYKWRQRTDEELHRLAAPHGHVYDPAVLRTAPEKGPEDVSQFSYGERQLLDVDRPTARRYRDNRSRDTMTARQNAEAAHAFRLAELERLGLAVRMGDGKWRLDADLLDKLDTRDRTEPRTRLVVSRQRLHLKDQVSYLGPVWLDRVGVDGLAHFGFGGELRDAIRARAEGLRQRGIDPHPVNRHGLLRDLERRSIEKRITEETGDELVRNVPSKFRGKVRVHEGQAGGPSYAEVHGGGRFVLVPLNRELRALAGQSVTLFRGSDGRFHVRPTDRDRGGS